MRRWGKLCTIRKVACYQRRAFHEKVGKHRDSLHISLNEQAGESEKERNWPEMLTCPNLAYIDDAQPNIF